MLEWRNDTRLTVDGVDFVLAPSDLKSARAPVHAGAMVLRKPPWMIERYAGLELPSDANVFELGIYEGGSTAFLALLFRPRRLVAIDLEGRRTAALDQFIDQRALTQVVRPHYGVDQADRATLEALVEAEFGSEPLDLVIDDASHLLAPTTASFNVLFPRLRPGGLFVVEDWSWQHVRDDAVRDRLGDPEVLEAFTRNLEREHEPMPPSERPLSWLALQLVLAAAVAKGMVAEVTVQRGLILVLRSETPLDPATFDIAQSLDWLGRSMLA